MIQQTIISCRNLKQSDKAIGQAYSKMESIAGTDTVSIIWSGANLSQKILIQSQACRSYDTGVDQK